MHSWKQGYHFRRGIDTSRRNFVQEVNFPFLIESAIGWRPKYSWQLFIISLELVLKISIIIIVNGNWSERSRVRLIGQASKAYSIVGSSLVRAHT